MDSRTAGSNLSVGVGILDRDHREISEVLQELHGDLETGRMRSRTGTLLRRLAHFTMTHFALEEGMMGATRYPMTELHRLEHQSLMQQTEALAAQSRQSKFTLNDCSLALIAKSHLDHIQKDDLHYGLWLDRSSTQSQNRMD